MNKKIPIFKTWLNTLNTIKTNLSLFPKVLTMVVITTMIISCALIINYKQPHSAHTAIWMGASYVILFYFGIVINNVICRIVLNGTPGHIWWRMSETYCVFKFIMLVFLVTLATVLFSFIYLLSFFVPTILLFDINIDEIHPGLYTLFGLMFLVANFSLQNYLFARFAFLIPATAAGEKMGIFDSWKLTQSNGWRIFWVQSLPLFILTFGGVALLEYFLNNDAIILVVLLTIFMQCMMIFFVTNNAVVYKTWKEKANRDAG